MLSGLPNGSQCASVSSGLHRNGRPQSAPSGGNARSLAGRKAREEKAREKAESEAEFQEAMRSLRTSFKRFDGRASNMERSMRSRRSQLVGCFLEAPARGEGRRVRRALLRWHNDRRAIEVAGGPVAATARAAVVHLLAADTGDLDTDKWGARISPRPRLSSASASCIAQVADVPSWLGSQRPPAPDVAGSAAASIPPPTAASIRAGVGVSGQSLPADGAADAVSAATGVRRADRSLAELHCAVAQRSFGRRFAAALTRASSCRALEQRHSSLCVRW
eukprot:CAMPEP_0183529190 /NCGR_PEP_ID=MMETSP0371-20130417/23241_1 /TAXON_ID=268820 /ORGANISM="Peridinium aciculiferum, Strain PAER-2" /LENGTH=276 /DNA_ID=CAMNT_0025728903 /DNA_START=49 /DNA_END=876 /DNA_ORIENTATION=-